ncbi:hypothetical protein R50345_16005 [Paenibacillus sp. FSL R5-0345]|uniref:hypothetical protein n=1 Tax=Paenibacillus sp. FSL R5-0345 TaxID=1536770 RepID=UPI0004F5A33E|nr:hypothetical protein [Paenibacillus sp. FSL R5-0345]AIQ35989.1 hypothetical protein R50345_16005 [Paenibacillus sp. FSL R5-0345]
MNRDEHFIDTGIATVTSKGLYFANNYYTSPLMIRLQWFFEAGKNGEWKIPVLFNKDDSAMLLISNFKFSDFAFRIEQPYPLDQEILNAYYLAFNNLKENN